MKTYTLKSCEELIQRYVHQLGGQATTIDEGCLGLGTLILHDAPGKKSVLIREVYLNEWSSGHTIRKYNKLPAKYQKIIYNV
jgi:hypothetical protein